MKRRFIYLAPCFCLPSALLDFLLHKLGSVPDSSKTWEVSSSKVDRSPFPGITPPDTNGRINSGACGEVVPQRAQRRSSSRSLPGLPTKVDLHVCHVTKIGNRTFVASHAENPSLRRLSAKTLPAGNFALSRLNRVPYPKLPVSTGESSAPPGSWHTEVIIPDLNAALRFCDLFPCELDFPSLQSPHRFSWVFRRPA
jgi:hypothetical protein